jgi:hypothetical protein
MNTEGLEKRLVAHWLQAAEDLGVRVTAPIGLADASGRPFTCEALVHDFGSPTGAVVVSPKTERRVRANLRSLGDKVWVSGSARRLPAYSRAHFIEVLVDWGWFGEAGAEPEWYLERVPRSG